MADVITRFKLETTQYDSKLRDAAKGLADVTKQATLAGNEFGKYTQKNVEAAKSFGNIATSATNSKDKVKELVGAFNDVAKAYNVLTKEQQQSDFGKALAESMATLKGRISEAKAEMNSTGGILGQLKDKFTINIDALKLFNAGVTAAKAALDVAKDAFFASEANVDEWGRTIDASKSLYEGFLTALNTGDISGYLSRIDSIVQAARQAYNELDRLGTMKTIQAPQMSAQQTENERMRMMIQTGRYIAPVDGRKASMQNGQLLTPDQIKRIEQQLQNGMQKVVTLVGNEVTQTSRAIDAVYNRQAQELGMSLKEFRKGTSSMAEFDKRMAGYEKYKEFESAHTVTSTFQSSAGAMVQSRRDNVANPYAEFAKWRTFRVDGQRYNDLVKLIQQRDQQAGQAYSMQSQAYRTMNRAEGVTLRQIMNGGSGGGGRSGGAGGMATSVNELTEMQSNQQRINELTQEYVNISDQSTEAVKERQVAIRQEISELEKRNGVLKLYQEQAKGKFLGGDVQKTGLANSSLSSSVSGTFDVGTGLSPEAIAAANQWIKNMEEGGNKVRESWKNAASAIGMVGSAMSSVKDPAAQIASTVAMAIANIAMAYSETLAKDKTNKSNIWYFIATAAAAMVSMATTISSIHSATGYAQGGMIKGNSYSGDNIGGVVDGSQLVGLNAGEIVLNQAQTSNVANALKGGGMGNMHLTARLDGKDLLLSIDRTGQTMGYGQLVFFK